jgi:hypothetical protein
MKKQKIQSPIVRISEELMKNEKVFISNIIKSEVVSFDVFFYI